MADSRVGRPSKGTRRTISASIPEEHLPVYNLERKRLGLGWRDYFAYKLAIAEGLELPDYLRAQLLSKQHNDPSEGGAVAV